EQQPSTSHGTRPARQYASAELHPHSLRCNVCGRASKRRCLVDGRRLIRSQRAGSSWQQTNNKVFRPTTQPTLRAALTIVSATECPRTHEPLRSFGRGRGCCCMLRMVVIRVKVFVQGS
ncbi:unnamed protein product, partial [Ectocarpus sp. 4 AP-2014]